MMLSNFFYEVHFSLPILFYEVTDLFNFLKITYDNFFK
jgi:hypothetical protein